MAARYIRPTRIIGAGGCRYKGERGGQCLRRTLYPGSKISTFYLSGNGEADLGAPNAAPWLRIQPRSVHIQQMLVTAAASSRPKCGDGLAPSISSPIFVLNVDEWIERDRELSSRIEER